MPPPPRTPKPKPKKRRASKRKPKVTVQFLMKRFPRAFGPNPRCVADNHTTSARRMRKTPRGDPEKCVGSVRVGQNGTHLYLAQKYVKKNPRIKYSTAPTGRGAHLAWKWTTVYDARTKKAFKVPSGARFLY